MAKKLVEVTEMGIEAHVDVIEKDETALLMAMTAVATMTGTNRAVEIAGVTGEHPYGREVYTMAQVKEVQRVLGEIRKHIGEERYERAVAKWKHLALNMGVF
jgi:hypothetical protein